MSKFRASARKPSAQYEIVHKPALSGHRAPSLSWSRVARKLSRSATEALPVPTPDMQLSANASLSSSLFQPSCVAVHATNFLMHAMAMHASGKVHTCAVQTHPRGRQGHCGQQLAEASVLRLRGWAQSHRMAAAVARETSGGPPHQCWAAAQGSAAINMLHAETQADETRCIISPVTSG